MSGMEFRILGPLEVVEDGRTLDLGGPKQRALLAALLLRANEVVSQDALIDDLWGESPPTTAAKTLQAYVSRLRKALAGPDDEARSDGAAGDARARLRPADRPRRRSMPTRSSACWRRDGRRTRATIRSWPSIGSVTRSRSGAGQPLADLAYESFAQPEIARLEELRLTALEERIDADLRSGPRRRADRRAEILVERHPLRERLRGQLMLALYRAGRQAQALQVYQDGRQHLAAELGLEPSEGLRHLERQILEQDPELGSSSRRTRPAIVPASAWRHPVRIAVAGAVVLARRARGRGVAARGRGRGARDGRRDRARPGHRRTARHDLLRHRALERRRRGGQRLGPRRRRQDGDPDRPRDERRPARLQHVLAADGHRRGRGRRMGRQRAEPRAERLSRERVTDRPRVRGRRRAPSTCRRRPGAMAEASVASAGRSSRRRRRRSGP